MQLLLKILAVGLVLVAIVYGVLPSRDDPYAEAEMMAKKEGRSDVFWDEVETNTNLPNDINDLTFVDTQGNQVQLTDFHGKKNVVLVITRGFSGQLCPFCRTQSSRLVANYDEFQKRDAEVLLVYPGGSEHLEEFIDAAKVSEKKEVDQIPFPILLDSDLKAVNYLQIAAELAFPSTYILDKAGNVRFAYVGEQINDRPSVKAMLAELDKLAG
ncbi:MAG: peroxiredoxin family protein [Planctomycetota bacterium]